MDQLVPYQDTHPVKPVNLALEKVVFEEVKWIITIHTGPPEKKAASIVAEYKHNRLERKFSMADSPFENLMDWVNHNQKEMINDIIVRLEKGHWQYGSTVRPTPQTDSRTPRISG